jgi:ribosomal protein L11 methylase PrmA
MFCAYNWFARPELYAAIRTAALDWAGAGERVVFLETGPTGTPRPPEKRALTGRELAYLKRSLDRAWRRETFGGFISGPTLLDQKGWCNFKLNAEKTEAQLDYLLLEENLAELPPLQNPALHLALLALLDEAPCLEAVYLPFGEISDLDQAALKMFGLVATEEAGWWLAGQKFQRQVDFLTLSRDLLTPTWLELKIEVEPALAKLVLRLFARFGFRDKISLGIPFRSGPLGEEIEDETAPVTIMTWLPKNERGLESLRELQAALQDLARVRPVPEIKQVEVSREEAKPFDQDPSTGIYRVGRRLVIRVIRDDPPTPDYQAAPEDLLINLKQSFKGFGPSEQSIHPTSQLALELLEERLDPAEHSKVLDLGTGTGTLAIAAARLGIPYTLALDANREALGVARQNVSLNGLEGQVAIEAGSLGLKDDFGGAYSFSEELQQRPSALDANLPFDAILANLFARNLINLSQELSRSLRPGGLLISSGIQAEYGPAVATAFQEAGLELLEQHDLMAWVAFVHRKV